jgi:DNA-binding response OmpR family regulator
MIDLELDIKTAALKYDNQAFSETPYDHFIEGAKWAIERINKPKSDISVDLHSFTVNNNGKILKLPRKVTAMIHYFTTHKNKAITREELIKNIWEPDVVVGPRTIDVHVVKIKQALGNDCIEAIKGIGFRWIK